LNNDNTRSLVLGDYPLMAEEQMALVAVATINMDNANGVNLGW
jgi:hypothetical protein